MPHVLIDAQGRDATDAGLVRGHLFQQRFESSPQRAPGRPELPRQLDVVARLNEHFASRLARGKEPPFRILTGIECDINVDGTLDQEPDLLAGSGEER